MKFFFDFFPVLLFFIVYKIFDIFTATGCLIIASALQVCLFWLQHRRFEMLHIVTFILVTLMGAATLLLRDVMFIKMKPTLINGVFALAFLMSQFFGRKPLVQHLLEANIQLEQRVWYQLNAMWITFFILIGGANLLIALFFSTNTWVNFKLFGMLGLTLIFILLQSVYLARFMPSDHET